MQGRSAGHSLTSDCAPTLAGRLHRNSVSAAALKPAILISLFSIIFSFFMLFVAVRLLHRFIQAISPIFLSRIFLSGLVLARNRIKIEIPAIRGKFEVVSLWPGRGSVPAGTCLDRMEFYRVLLVRVDGVAADSIVLDVGCRHRLVANIYGWVGRLRVLSVFV